jgi:hypothetical protein
MRYVMILKTVTILTLLISEFCSAQNLVPNPSFENYISCPTNLNQIYKCQDWHNWGYNPDYFNSCAGSSLVGVPLNYYGQQIPAEGSAYCAFLNHSVPWGIHDFIGAQLVQPLIVGQTYFVSLQICHIYGNCTTNKMGVRFSTLPFDSINHPPINNFAHIYTDSIIADTLIWFKIKGSFVADSNYAYISIGNFFTDPGINTFCGNIWSSYYYLDDICVSTDSTICYSPVGLNDEEKVIDIIKIFPNPVSDNLRIKVSGISPAKKCLSIYNIIGKEVLRENFSSQEYSVDVSRFAKGIYFIEVKNENNITQRKFVKE